MVLFRPWATNKEIYFHYGNFIANLYSEKIIKKSIIIKGMGFVD